MSDSLQKWVGRNRPPRVQITYDVEIGNAFEKKELPLVVGLMADLSGQPENPLPKFKERRFVEIDRDNFNDVMTKIAPRLDISVPDTLKGEGNLKVELHFNQIDQFEPESIVNQIPRLARLLEAVNSCVICWANSTAMMSWTHCLKTFCKTRKTSSS